MDVDPVGDVSHHAAGLGHVGSELGEAEARYAEVTLIASGDAEAEDMVEAPAGGVAGNQVRPRTSDTVAAMVVFRLASTITVPAAKPLPGATHLVTGWPVSNTVSVAATGSLSLDEMVSPAARTAKAAGQCHWYRCQQCQWNLA